MWNHQNHLNMIISNIRKISVKHNFYIRLKASMSSVLSWSANQHSTILGLLSKKNNLIFSVIVMFVIIIFYFSFKKKTTIRHGTAVQFSSLLKRGVFLVLFWGVFPLNWCFDNFCSTLQYFFLTLTITFAFPVTRAEPFLWYSIVYCAAHVPNLRLRGHRSAPFIFRKRNRGAGSPAFSLRDAVTVIMTAPTGWHSCLCGCSHGCHTLTTLYCIVCVQFMIPWQSCTFVVYWSRFSLGSTQGSKSQSRQVWTITTASCSLSLKIILNAVRWDKIFSIYPRSLETIVSQLKPINRIQVSKHKVLKSSSSCLCETHVKYLYTEWHSIFWQCNVTIIIITEFNQCQSC